MRLFCLCYCLLKLQQQFILKKLLLIEGALGPCANYLESPTSTLTCLMQHVDSKDMSKECEKRLLEVQYFLARDWTLDPELYQACHFDAVNRYVINLFCFLKLKI